MVSVLTFPLKRVHHVLLAVLPPKRIKVLLLVLIISSVCIPDAKRSRSFPTQSFIDEEIIEEVVVKAREGNDDSFAMLYQWYYKQIYWHLFRMVGNHEDTTDLAVESFTRAWRALPSLYDGRRFPGWLYRIATNTALDHLRRKKRNHSLWESADKSRIDDSIESFEKRVEMRDLIQLALLQISQKPRSCLCLHLKGFSQDEIAGQLGLGKDSVNTYISIARAQFRKAYHRLLLNDN
jgi:RNA polymerase sigma factor (sigma-70 family)